MAYMEIIKTIIKQQQMCTVECDLCWGYSRMFCIFVVEETPTCPGERAHPGGRSRPQHEPGCDAAEGAKQRMQYSSFIHLFINYIKNDMQGDLNPGHPDVQSNAL